jgi:hypothetical protein
MTGLLYKLTVQLTLVIDWQCQVDTSEILQTFAGYHPDLLAVMK